MFYSQKGYAKAKGYSKLRKKLSKTDILVFRESPSGILNSKPCSECIKTMKSLRIRRVYYSIDDGSLVYEKISDIKSSHLSQMTRHLNREF